MFGLGHGRSKGLVAGGGVVVPPAPVMPEGLIADWDAAAMTAQVDNTPATSQTDSVSGLTATQATTANQPRYRTNIINGFPGIQSVPSGGQSQFLTVPNGSNPVNTAVAAGNVTVVQFLYGVQVGDDPRSFGIGETNNDNFTLLASGTRAGSDTANSIPYTSGGLTMVARTYKAGDYYRHYVNGSCIQEGGAPASTFAGGRIVLGGNYIPGYSATVGFKGTILRTMVFSRGLELNEVQRVWHLGCDRYGVPRPITAFGKMIVGFGDSLTAGVGSTAIENGWVYRAMQALGVPLSCWHNLGVSGETTEKMIARAPREVIALAKELAVLTITALEEFPNQALTSGDQTGQAVINKMRDLLTLLKQTSNIKPLLATSTDFNASTLANYHTARTNYNNYWNTASNRIGLADGYLALHTVNGIGPDGSVTANPGNFDANDLLHLTDAGYALKAAAWVPVLQGVAT